MNDPAAQRPIDRARRDLWIGLACLVAVSVGFGVLHALLGDESARGRHWFDLDEERNLPTWWNGGVFALLGAVALVAFYLERLRSSDGEPGFQLSWLWLGVAAAGFAMSIDDIMILHENLFWEEVREKTTGVDDSMKYITQWQVLYAVPIICVLLFMTLFFVNRFKLSAGARWAALGGIGCWILASLVEAVRQGIKFEYRELYSPSVLVEEELEILGAILLVGSIASYCLVLGLDFTEDRRRRLTGGMFTRGSVVAALVVLVLLSGVAGAAYLSAKHLEQSGAPVPSLVRKALANDPDPAGAVPETDDPGTPDAGAPPGGIWFGQVEGRLPTDLGASQADWNAVVLPLIGLAEESTLPESILSDSAPRLVFFSVSSGEESASVFLGRGDGIVAAARDARQQAAASGSSESTWSWRKLDIVSWTQSLGRRSLDRIVTLPPGSKGVAFEDGSGFVLLPDELIAGDVVDSDGTLDTDDAVAYLLRSPREGGIESGEDLGVRPAWLFHTRSFMWSGESVVPVFRGHEQVRTLERDDLLGASGRAGAYLTRAVRPSGQFEYDYRADEDRLRDSYNILRHAGTCYAMMQLYRVTGDRELLEAGERALGYLLTQIKPWEDAAKPGTQMAVLTEFDDDEGMDVVKLGGNGLAIIALVEHARATGSMANLETATALAEWIVAQQTPEGRFRAHKQTYEGKLDMGFVSGYYPGEALLGLMRIHAIAPRDEWADAALAGALWLSQVRDVDVSDAMLNHDHWLLYALNELYRVRAHPELLAHSRRIGKVIMSAQHRRTVLPDWLGGFYRPPRANPTATRCEGLAAAYMLERDLGDPVLAAQMLDTLRLGNMFVQRLQLRPASVMHLPDPQRALGGIRDKFTHFRVRIDTVQHTISSMLLLHGILE